ncbi:MAG: dNTP triphosphohydrolase [Succinivibrionaceae bacterium]|nr:dNTP triphosphohydrolase [Succinivibrionaceae bacterium]
MLESSNLEALRFYDSSGELGYDFDREEVVTAAPVRRLQQKTQVYPLDIKASSRSRLTHSLEVQCRVAAVVAALARRNDFYSDHLYEIVSICETAALVHDVGNPPFGHFGENVIVSFFSKYLDELYAMSLGAEGEMSRQWKNLLKPDLANFDGNAQNLRILHSIQKLNLSAQVLASCIKVPYLADESVDGELGCFYSESVLLQFVREAFELEPGERFELARLLEYADNISYALADIEDAADRGLVDMDDLKRDLRSYCNSPGAELFDEIVLECSKRGCSFTGYFRRNCMQRAIEAFAEGYNAALETAGGDDFSFDGADGPNDLLHAMSLYAREKIFKCREIEALELTGNAALRGILKIYSRLLALPRADFQQLLRGKELPDPILGRLFRRISPRVLSAYKEAVSGGDLEFENDGEKEFYFRVRLIIDYVTGMTDTYIHAEFSLLSGLDV